MSSEQQEVAQQQSTALTLPERARAALGLVNIEAQLQELATKTVSITSITNADGYKQVHAARMALKSKRVEIDKRAKEARDDANKFSRAIIVEGDRLVAIIQPEEQRLEKLQTAWDEAREAERRAKVEAERQRIASIRDRIQNDIRDIVVGFAGRSASDIQTAITDLVAIQIDESFAEFRAEAEQAKAASLEKLRAMHARQVEIEAEQQRLADERAELERQRLANEEAARKERERIAAEEAEAKRQREAEAAAAAAERQRKLDEEMAKLRAQREENERAAKAERERLAEEWRQQEAAAAERQRAEQQRLDEQRAAAEAEHARIAADNARQAEELRRQQAELDLQRQEQEAARAELERQQALANTASMPIPASALSGVDLEQQTGVIEISTAAAKEFAPTLTDIAGVIAAEYGVSIERAFAWCRDAVEAYEISLYEGVGV